MGCVGCVLSRWVTGIDFDVHQLLYERKCYSWMRNVCGFFKGRENVAWRAGRIFVTNEWAEDFWLAQMVYAQVLLNKKFQLPGLRVAPKSH